LYYKEQQRERSKERRNFHGQSKSKNTTSKERKRERITMHNRKPEQSSLGVKASPWKGAL
jgi:hypothetical protein